MLLFVEFNNILAITCQTKGLNEGDKNEHIFITQFLGVHYVLYGAVFSAIKAGVDKVNMKKVVSEFEQKYPLWYDSIYIKTLPRYKKVFLKTVKKKNFTLLRIMTYIHTLLLKLK